MVNSQSFAYLDLVNFWFLGKCYIFSQIFKVEGMGISSAHCLGESRLQERRFFFCLLYTMNDEVMGGDFIYTFAFLFGSFMALDASAYLGWFDILFRL